ncbi:hypothetical protein QNO07_05420 [Streptomyces sp. 549]|nr:hypothetical protein [Streptomyces sp. 549]
MIPLAPLLVGDLLGGAFNTIRRLSGPLYGYVGKVAGLAALVISSAVLLAHTVAGVSLWDAGRTGSGGAGGTFALGVLILLVTVCVAVVLVAGSAVEAATLVAVSHAVVGTRPAPGELHTRVRAKLPSLVLCRLLLALTAGCLGAAGYGMLVSTFVFGAAQTSLAGVLPLLLGGLAALTAAAYLYVRFAFSSAVCVLEGKPPMAALRRSGRLVKGAWWRTFGVTALASVLSGALAQVAQSALLVVAVPLTFLALATGDAGSTGTVVALLIVALVMVAPTVTMLPFTYAIAALLYTDRRIRTEDHAATLAAAAGPGPWSPQPPTRPGSPA